ncbi:hypothetical protein JCM2811A_40010 [Methylorubrum rhodinum]
MQDIDSPPESREKALSRDPAETGGRLARHPMSGSDAGGVGEEDTGCDPGARDRATGAATTTATSRRR